MQKWFLAIYLVSNTKRGITARQLAKEIEVTKDTALYMLVRIRRAFKEYGGFLNSIIDVENGSTSVNDLKLVTI
jgi:orotate phosphoribosyltransferase-like protein